MQAFATLLDRLIYTRSRNAKLKLIAGDVNRVRPDLGQIMVTASRMKTMETMVEVPGFEEKAFFDRVRKAYQELAKSEPARVRIIDGARTESEVKVQVKKYLIDT